MSTSSRSAKGFTLIELMVTMSILGLLLVAVAPGIIEWLNNTRLRNVATSVQTGLQRARMEAVRRNQPVRFSLLSNACALSGSGVAWIVSLNDPSGKCTVAASETTDPMIIDRSSAAIGGGSALVTATAADATAATTVTFNGFGRVIDASPIARIVINNSTAGSSYGNLRVDVGTGGTVRMCDPNVSDATDPRKC